MNDVSWGALALALAVLGGLYTWRAWHRRGLGAAVRGAGYTLVPVAAWLTGSLELFGDYVDDTSRWLTRLAFNPVVWFGVALAVLAVLLIGVGGVLSRRSEPAETRKSKRQKGRPAVGAAPPPKSGPVVDDEMAEIEAMLKKRGIS
ncbi:MAG: hypothetical protein ACR2K3_03260 [Nocardioides sp.]